ncbi:hypothetical protein [Erythrobacter longus]|nr:hypothetical protein [Erythrobacter longus]
MTAPRSGPVRVQLGKGRYILTEILWLERSDIVLAGMGMGEEGTQLFMPRPLNQIEDDGVLTEICEYLKEEDKYERQPDRNLDVLFSEHSWSAGFIWARYPGGRHATYLPRYDREIETIAHISSGTQFEREVTVAEIYGDTDEKIGSRHWQFPDRPLARQATRIESINGNTVTIADPLLLNIASTVPASFAKWDHLSNVGVEDLYLVFPENPYFGHHVESGFNGIYFTGVHDGNVHNVLVDGLTVRNPTEHSLSFNTQATKSVYTNSTVWTTPTLDQHAGANHQNLYDNVTVHVTPDQTAEDGVPRYDLYKAGGAGYWQPGHGRYNTTWNLKVNFTGGASAAQEVEILAGSEGPDARIVGMHGNRPIGLNHKPAPYVELLNSPVTLAPSLYAYQLSQRAQP